MVSGRSGAVEITSVGDEREENHPRGNAIVRRSWSPDLLRGLQVRARGKAAAKGAPMSGQTSIGI
jgi:hypothetical protein